MSSRFRLAFKIFAALIFLIVAPMVVLYTMGYRYDFKNKRVSKIGMIYIESYPRKARVFLNGKPQKYTTPVALEKLKPKTYKVRVEKEDYAPWEKNLEVKPSTITNARSIFLVPEKISIRQLVPESVQKFKLSPDQEITVWISKEDNKQQIVLFNLEKQTSILAQEIPNSDHAEIIQLEWAPNSERILLGIKKDKGEEYLIFIPKSKRFISLNTILPLGAKRLAWHPKDSKKIYFQNKNGQIILLNIDQKKSEFITNFGVLDYYLGKNLIYFIKSEDKGPSGLLYSNFNGKEVKELIKLPEKSLLKISIYSQEKIALIFPSPKTLYLYSAGELKKIHQGVEDVEWSPDGKKIFWKTEFEFWIYNLDKKDLVLEQEKPILLTRFSEIIREAHWYATSSHIIFLKTNVLYLIEIDPRDKPNIVPLTQINLNKPTFVVGKRGERLFFLDIRNAANQVNLFEAELITKRDFLF